MQSEENSEKEKGEGSKIVEEVRKKRLSAEGHVLYLTPGGAGCGGGETVSSGPVQGPTTFRRSLTIGTIKHGKAFNQEQELRSFSGVFCQRESGLFGEDAGWPIS